MEPNNSNTNLSGKGAFDGSALSDLRAQGVEVITPGSSQENNAAKPVASPAPKMATLDVNNPKEIEAPKANPLISAAVKSPAPQPAPVAAVKAEVPVPPFKPVAETPNPGFQRMSFGVAAAMPKTVESNTPTSTPIPPVAPAPIAKAPEPAPVSMPPRMEAFVPKPPVQPITPLNEIPRAEIPKAPPVTVQPVAPKIPPQMSGLSMQNPASITQAMTGVGAKNDPSIKPIRTFKSDAEEAVRYQNVSAIDIAVAEQKKREVTPTAIEYTGEKKSSGGLFIFILLAVLVLIAGGWYYWYFTTSNEVSPTPDVTPQTKVDDVTANTIIPYAKAATLAIPAGSDALALIGAKLSSANAGLGNIYALIPTQGATSTVLAPIDSILGETTIPPRLLRSLGSDYMIGAYTSEAQSAFVILTNTFFQNAFSGMLEWEKDIRTDLLPIIAVTHPGEASSTTTKAFEDAVVSNIDTRLLRDTFGTVILAYAFPDKDTVVIATNTETLKYILDKMLVVRTIQ